MPLFINSIAAERSVGFHLDRSDVGGSSERARFRVTIDGQPAWVEQDPADPSWCIATTAPRPE